MVGCGSIDESCRRIWLFTFSNNKQQQSLPRCGSSLWKCWPCVCVQISKWFLEFCSELYRWKYGLCSDFGVWGFNGFTYRFSTSKQFSGCCCTFCLRWRHVETLQKYFIAHSSIICELWSWSLW